MSDRPPLTAAESAVMLTEAKRRQSEFDRWVSDMIHRTIPVGDENRDAYRTGWRAGRLRLDEDARKRSAAPFLADAHRLVAWSCGYSEGRAMRAMTQAELGTHERRRDALFAIIRAH